MAAALDLPAEVRVFEFDGVDDSSCFGAATWSTDDALDRDVGFRLPNILVQDVVDLPD